MHIVLNRNKFVTRRIILRRLKLPERKGYDNDRRRSDE